MAQYKVLKPLFKSSEKKEYKPNETVELTDEEANGAVSFKAVVLIPQTAQPKQEQATTVPSQATKQVPTDKTAGDAK
jgi:hypothetical protein